jgi:hypothetical protein
MNLNNLFRELETRYGLLPRQHAHINQPAVRVVDPPRRVVQRECWQARMVHNRGGSYITAARYYTRQQCIDKVGHLVEFVEAVLTDTYPDWV